MPDVFISYNREDRDRAGVIANALEADGFSVWWDAALRAGETYDEVTEQNLRQAGAVVVLWSKRSSNSKWVRAEATVGERSSTLVPALIEDCERPIRFELVQTADLRHWRGDRNDPHWRAFMQDVRTAISKRSARQQPAPAQAMTSQDASIETTFWNSIKDGADRSDFEAYLKRYPNGYFAALAQNRLAALARSAPPRPSPSQAPRTASAAPQRSAPQQAPAQRAAAPQKSAPKKSGNGLIFGGIAASLAVIAVVTFVLTTRGGEPPAAEPIAAAATQEAAEQAPATVAEEIATLAAAQPLETSLDKATAMETADAAIEDVYAEEGAPEETVAASDVIEGAEEFVAAEPLSAAAEPVAAPAAAVAKPFKVKTAKTFRDCESCPLMAKLPKGTFVMGSPVSEAGHNAYEGPQREVNVAAFAIGVYELTQAEWNACAADGACPQKRVDGEGALPALGVSWREAEAYAEWLSKKTGREYRLPSESEWEYAARGGATSAYWWGDVYDRSRVSTGEAHAVGSSGANAFGLHDVIGNAREWVADCYVNNFSKAPADGSAVTDGDCGKRVIRGGGWSSSPADMRTANRSRVDVNVHAGYMGVRIAAEVK